MKDDTEKYYDTSKDYGYLYDLLTQGIQVVCFVDYAETCRDVAGARSYMPDANIIVVNARGIQYNGYIRANERDKFLSACQQMHLTFIDPDHGMLKDSRAQ